MAATAARSWSALLPALRDHPTARDFVPVASVDPGASVAVFPVLRRQWADRQRVPRRPPVCAAYVKEALALLDAHWPLEGNEAPDPTFPGTRKAVDGALRFVIYFSERNIPTEREYEFLLAEPILRLVRVVQKEAMARKYKWEVTFNYVRDLVAQRLREIGANGPLVLRDVLRALQRDEPKVEDAFQLNLLLHDADHVLAACELALVPLRLQTTEYKSGNRFPETTVRVAWPGLVEADGRLHLPFPNKPFYAAQKGSLLPFVRPSTAAAGEATSERGVAACFNIATLEAICHSEDLLRDATTHRAPPLRPLELPAPPLRPLELPAPPSLIESLLADALPPSPRGEEFDFGTL